MLDFVRLLLPRACPGCGGQLGAQAGLCAACQVHLTPEVSAHSLLCRAPRAHLVSLGRYDARLKRTVRALKFGGSREVAGVLAAKLAPAVPREWNLSAVCGVPLHPLRERERGYNQAELLARAVASELNLTAPPLLRRTRATRQQARLHAGERRENVRGAFEARISVPPRVLLIDDVLTTGTTLRECAEVLREGGARDVYFMVVAR